jgi:hypothetical protein
VNTQPDGVALTETITKFSADNLTFTYNIVGLPSFIKEATNTWKVESVTEAEFKPTLQRIYGNFNMFPGWLILPIYQWMIAPANLKAQCKDA